MTALPEATTAASQWTTAARPIILAMFAAEDAIAPVTTVRLADPKGYASYTGMSANARTYQEAQSIVAKAVEGLRDLLEGIRDNYLCDNYVMYPRDGSEAEQDVADEFNKDLADSVITVDAFVRQMEREL